MPDLRITFEGALPRIELASSQGARWLKMFTGLQVTLVEGQTVSGIPDAVVHKIQLAALADGLAVAVQQRA